MVLFIYATDPRTFNSGFPGDVRGFLIFTRNLEITTFCGLYAHEVRTAVLADDEFCQGRVGVFDIYRIL